MFGKKKEEDTPTKLGESYSWITDWTCPECGHAHSKPHFSFIGQVDYKKKPNEVGRVKKDREEKDDACSNELGPVYDNAGLQRPMFCPHCGWEHELIHIVKVKAKKK